MRNPQGLGTGGLGLLLGTLCSLKQDARSQAAVPLLSIRVNLGLNATVALVRCP